MGQWKNSFFSLDVIDLSDQTGVRKNLLSNPADYAIKHMEERDTLILIKIESELWIISSSNCSLNEFRNRNVLIVEYYLHWTPTFEIFSGSSDTNYGRVL